jgi:hypothetical protein
MPIHVERPSQITYWFLYVVVFVPAVLIPFFTVNLPEKQLVLFCFALTSCFMILGMFTRLRNKKIKKLRVPKRIFWLFFLSISSFTLISLILSFGFTIRLVSLSEVYEVRSRYQELLQGSSRAFPYLINWLANVLNPFLIIFGLTNKNILLIVFGTVCQMLLYSLTGFKSVLFSIALILLVLFLISSKERTSRFGLYLLWGNSLGIVLCICLDLFWDNYIPLSIFVRRVLITPGLLTGFYLDFFSTHPKLFLSHSVLRGFFAYPYNQAPPFVIGLEYFNNPETAANVNFYGDAFANFGFYGMLIFTLILGIFFWIFDSLTKKIDLRISGGLLSVSSFSLLNSALLTSLMTHGLLVCALLMFLFPVTKRSSRHRGDLNA